MSKVKVFEGRKVKRIIASEMITLDGYFAGQDGEIDWFFWNEEMAQSAIDLISTADTLLFGRVTYELMASYWPSASPPTEDPIIIDKMNNLPKIVFSRALKKVEWGKWNNVRLVKEITSEEILKMKKQPGKNMVIYGSGSIVSAFMNLGLIDEYYLFVNPVVLGRGKSLFKDLNDRHKMKLIRTKAFSNGVVLLHYQYDLKEAIKA
ncbi:dihydrofolate reductase family protein [Methanosarcina sp.]|uniref:dihydrofolate reductase family protein n=1 Tax=Methanosarcina sp. TaxID=2213 RepID=UPI002AB8E151|nr:dihydrofolate reductase family protein [Methanosarcina sp.]MDY9926913.1 dihydrofolate reductase family protein [Methanosarcina sp.]